MCTSPKLVNEDKEVVQGTYAVWQWCTMYMIHDYVSNFYLDLWSDQISSSPEGSSLKIEKNKIKINEKKNKKLSR